MIAHKETEAERLDRKTAQVLKEMREGEMKDQLKKKEDRLKRIN